MFSSQSLLTFELYISRKFYFTEISKTGKYLELPYGIIVRKDKYKLLTPLKEKRCHSYGYNETSNYSDICLISQVKI